MKIPCALTACSIAICVWLAAGTTNALAQVPPVQDDDAEIADEPIVLDPSLAIWGSTDERVPSNDSRVGRLFIDRNPARHDYGICTAWQISSGIFLAAGHCFGTGEVADCTQALRNKAFDLEFKVPLSTDTGAIKRATPENTYTGVVKDAQCRYVESDIANGGPSSDWAIFHVLPTQGKLPYERRQLFFRIAKIKKGYDGKNYRLPAFGIRVTGYGTAGPPPKFGEDGSPANKYNYTQQSISRAFLGLDETMVGGQLFSNILMQTDNTQGASGSPATFNGTTQAIGIVVGAVKKSGIFNNRATGFGDDTLAKAVHVYPGLVFSDPPISDPSRVLYVDPYAVSFGVQSATGDIFNPFGNLTSAFKAVTAFTQPTLLNAVRGNYPEVINTKQQITFVEDIVVELKGDLTLRMPVGDVSVWTPQTSLP